MPIVMFIAHNAPAGAIEKIFISAGDPAQIKPYLDHLQIATPGVTYKPYLVKEQPGSPPEVLCVQIARPVLSPAQVRGGQPTAQPIGQPGHMAPPAPRDMRSGFQPIPDQDIGVMEDNVFGDARDNTYSDILQTGNGPQEIPRPK